MLSNWFNGSTRISAVRTPLSLTLPLLFLALLGFAPPGLKGQNKSRPVARAKSQALKAESQSALLLFNYYPSVFDPSFKESEFVFVAIANDGGTQVVRYGPYHPTIIAVHQGTLPKVEVAQLVARSRLAIPKASEINIPYVGSCDAESFKLSLNPPIGSGAQSFMKYPACLPVMPEEILQLVEEMRTVWRRLDESPLGYGYARSFPLNEDFLKSPKRNPEQFVPIAKFSAKLRTLVRSVGEQTPKFVAISQAQFDELRALTTDPDSLYVIDKERAYSVSLFLSRSRPPSVPLRK